MKRTVTVIVLGLAALALLIGAALQSRAVPLDAHLARYTLAADVARLDEEFDTLINSLQAARAANQAPGEAASALHQRVLASFAALEQSAAAIPGSSPERNRIANTLERFRATLSTVDTLTTTVLEQQTAYADSLAYLRNYGADNVRRLGALEQEELAADTFQLVAETIEYATAPTQDAEYQLRRMLERVSRTEQDESPLAPLTSPLTAPVTGAVTRILDLGSGIESRLAQLASSLLVDNAEALNEAALAAYQRAVSGAERARTILATYSIVMLLFVAGIAYRLRISYRELNRANSELAELNESLELRVLERTEDLSTALAELKESQVQLVQAEKMSSLGQLVAGISHEINTPLLYLANNASLIQERIETINDFVDQCLAALSISRKDFDDRAEYQRRLVQGLKRLKALLECGDVQASAEEIRDLNRDCIEGLGDLTEMAQSLKDFSRLDRAPVDSFDVNAGIDKTLTIARNIVKHKAEIKRFYGDIPNIECSPSKINQVFLNLITNAAQAIEEHGEIIISTKRHGNDRIAISVSDNGCGIPEENLGKICDPFFTTKEVGDGTGLGLSIVDEIVRSHGGELKIESRVNEGSAFTVLLPVKQARSTDTPGATVLAEAV